MRSGETEAGPFVVAVVLGRLERTEFVTAAALKIFENTVRIWVAIHTITPRISEPYIKLESRPLKDRKRIR